MASPSLVVGSNFAREEQIGQMRRSWVRLSYSAPGVTVRRSFAEKPKRARLTIERGIPDTPRDCASSRLPTSDSRYEV